MWKNQNFNMSECELDRGLCFEDGKIAIENCPSLSIYEFAEKLSFGHKNSSGKEYSKISKVSKVIEVVATFRRLSQEGRNLAYKLYSCRGLNKYTQESDKQLNSKENVKFNAITIEDAKPEIEIINNLITAATSLTHKVAEYLILSTKFTKIRCNSSTLYLSIIEIIGVMSLLDVIRRRNVSIENSLSTYKRLNIVPGVKGNLLVFFI